MLFIMIKKYIVKPDTSYGYRDKNWGRNFTFPWIWLSSWNLFSNVYNKRLNNTCFEIGRGIPRSFRITFNNKLLANLYYDGKKIEFDFSKFWVFPYVPFDCYEDDEKNIGMCFINKKIWI